MHDCNKYTIKIAVNQNNILKTDNHICVTHMVSTYEKDKIFYQDDEYLLILDGVILNKLELIKAYEMKEWKDVVLEMYKVSDTFFYDFRGSFSGILNDIKNNKTIIFTDHIGTKFIYYVELDDSIFVSSMISNVYSFLKDNKVPYSLSDESAYLLLSYGYMLEDRTLCKEIKKIKPGCYIEINGNKIVEKRYCLLDNTPNYNLSEEDAIEIIDDAFRKAIKLEFEKDKEYGYKHLVALSAGLDSRMTCWVAHEMGYIDQLNITFSQSNYLDETIPKQIISDLKHEWLFKSLDNGLWLYDIESVTKVTGGNVLYYGLAHGNSMYKYMDFSKLGMIHSGQLGDVVVGTFYSEKDPNAQFRIGDGAYLPQYIDKIETLQLEQFANQEIAKFYHRGFNGANNGQLLEMLYTETCSPFMNWDFMQSVLKIPVELRFGHNIYKKWILKKYPQASKYVWEKIGCRIDRKWGVINHNGTTYKYMDIPKIILKKYFKVKFKANNKNMNPIGYYLANNKDLNSFVNNKLQQGINEIPSKLVSNLLTSAQKSTNPIEKIQAISLVDAYLCFF